MKNKIKITYYADNSIDICSFLQQKNYSLKSIHQLFQSKGIFLNQQLVNDNRLLILNDQLDLYLYAEESNIPTTNLPIDIIYEDDFILVVNKPHGLDVESSRRHYEDNLSRRVMSYFKQNHINATIHLVNRIDLETSGLVLIAKHGIIHHLFSKVPIIKKYLAKVHGHLINKQNQILIKIDRLSDSVKRVVSDLGKEAITNYYVVDEDDSFSLIDATLVTGRTHQLRVTFSHMGHPIVGDKLYGSNYAGPLHLCSYYLEFEHPITKKRMNFQIHPNF